MLIVEVVLALAYDWRRTQLADLAAQRQCLREFCASEEFAQFVGTADAQLVALNNFIASQPTVAGAALPEVEALERRAHHLPWTIETTPLPVATAGQPARVVAAHRALATRLAQRGFRFDATAQQAGRQLFLRLLSPHARAFLQRTGGRGFNALALDDAMEDETHTAFAARHGAGCGRYDVGRMFALYAKIGRAMWQAIERDRAEQTRNVFAEFKPGR